MENFVTLKQEREIEREGLRERERERKREIRRSAHFPSDVRKTDSFEKLLTAREPDLSLFHFFCKNRLCGSGESALSCMADTNQSRHVRHTEARRARWRGVLDCNTHKD